MKKYGEKRNMNVIFYKNRVIFVEKLRNKYSFTNYSKTDTIKPKKIWNRIKMALKPILSQL